MRRMYSKKQIEEIAKGSIASASEGTIAKALGLDEDGNIVKGQAGGEKIIAYEGVSVLPTDIEFTDWTLHRAIKIDSVLWIVVCGTITNKGASQASFNNMCEITLPSSISSKIYRADGTSCDQAPSSSVNTLILLDMGGAGSSERLANCYSESANKIRIKWQYNTSINAGASIQFNIRFPLFLDVGSVE